MRRRIKIALIIIGSFILILMIWCYFTNGAWWFIYPTNSSPHTLTIVGKSSLERIILRHYVDGKHINDYVLDMKAKLVQYTSQSYGLPKLKEGTVEVTAYWKATDETTDEHLTVTFEKAKDLYNEGLLIYWNIETIGYGSERNHYVYFISGTESISYFKKTGSLELLAWAPSVNAPKPKKFVLRDSAFWPYDSNWKEKNKWEVFSVN